MGWRLALKYPERVTALIVQNGNAYEEALKEFWDPIKQYWNDNSEDSRNALRKLFTLETTKFQYTDRVSDTSRISPDNWRQGRNRGTSASGMGRRLSSGDDQLPFSRTRRVVDR